MSTPTGKPLVKLPPIDYIVRRIPLTTETRLLYDEIKAELKRRVEAFQEKGTGSANYAVVCELSSWIRG